MKSSDKNEVKLEYRSVKCLFCGSEFRTPYINSDLIKLYNKICPACVKKREQTERETEERLFEEYWMKHCPAQFQIKPARINTEISNKIMAINLDDTPCVLIYGEPRSGKTYMALQLIKETMKRRKSMSFKFVLFSDFCFQSTILDANGFGDYIEQLKRVTYLCLDDICEYPMNQRAELAFLNLLETRFMNMKPTIATTAINSETIQTCFQTRLIAEKILDILKRFNIVLVKENKQKR